MSDWTRRRSVPQDEACLAALWLRSYARSYNCLRRGAHLPGEPERRYFFSHGPVVEHLLRSPAVVALVLCDPERSDYQPGSPAVIYAFAATGPGDVVHAVVVKRSYAEFAREMTLDLLGDRLARPHVCSHVLPEMMARGGGPSACGVSFPSSWVVDEHWLAKQILPRRAA